jgi:hypothetical protein
MRFKVKAQVGELLSFLSEAMLYIDASVGDTAGM